MPDWSFWARAFGTIVGGVPTTVLVFVSGYSLAVLGGLLLAIGAYARSSFARSAIRVWGSFWRRTPLLVQLYILFFALPQVGISLTPIQAGVMGLGLHYGAFTSEAFRAGLGSIPTGQWHAAIAIGMPRARQWSRIIIPQLLPRVFPVLGNYGLGLLKETALLATIGVLEMFGKARALASQTFRFTEPFTLVGITYLMLSIPLMYWVSRLERRRPVL